MEGKKKRKQKGRGKNLASLASAWEMPELAAAVCGLYGVVCGSQTVLGDATCATGARAGAGGRTWRATGQARTRRVVPLIPARENTQTACNRQTNKQAGKKNKETPSAAPAACIEAGCRCGESSVCIFFTLPFASSFFPQLIVDNRFQAGVALSGLLSSQG